MMSTQVSMNQNYKLNIMKIAIWNIDCPAYNSTKLAQCKAYLEDEKCDLMILTEVNSSLQFNNFNSCFSQKSPYIAKSKNYNKPNEYHQVGIYCKLPLKQIESTEPINTLICKIKLNNQNVLIYGNVITIKDQWAKWSDLKYKDRLDQQMTQIDKIIKHQCIIAGDFNFKYNSPMRKAGYMALANSLEDSNVVWRTKKENRTVQQLIYSNTFKAAYKVIEVDKKVSDHPLIVAEVQLK